MERSLAQDCSRSHPLMEGPLIQSSDRSTGAVEAREDRVPISTQRITVKTPLSSKLAYRRPASPRGNLRSTHCARSRNSASGALVAAMTRGIDATRTKRSTRPARARNVVSVRFPERRRSRMPPLNRLRHPRTLGPACFSALSGRHDLRRRLGLGLEREGLRSDPRSVPRARRQLHRYGQRVHEAGHSEKIIGDQDIGRRHAHKRDRIVLASKFLSNPGTLATPTAEGRVGRRS